MGARPRPATASSSASEKARKGMLVRLFNYTWTPARRQLPVPAPASLVFFPSASLHPGGAKREGKKDPAAPPAPNPTDLSTSPPPSVPLTAKSGHYDLITPPNADTTSRRTPGAARRINSRLLSRGTSAGEIKIDPRIIIITLAS